MGNINFTEKAWEEYLYWQTQDRKTIKRINQLLKDIIRNGTNGLGKFEPLKYDKSSFFSKRIDEVNRLVFQIKGTDIFIIQCKGHYDD